MIFSGKAVVLSPSSWYHNWQFWISSHYFKSSRKNGTEGIKTNYQTGFL